MARQTLVGSDSSPADYREKPDVEGVKIGQTLRIRLPEGNSINHPLHYGGAASPYEAVKVIEAWSLGFCLGNAVKYIARAGKKGGRRQLKANRLEDLKKASWYLDREISTLEASS